MKKICYVLLLEVLFLSPSFSQVDSLESFFPLQVGNVWQYEVKHVFMSDTTYSYEFTTVLGDTILGPQSKFYYVVEVAYPGWGMADTIGFYRYDSLLGSIMEYNNWQGEESIFFKLDAVENDCWDYFDNSEICYCGEDTSSIFGENKINKCFYLDHSGPPSWAYHLAKDFGPVIIYDNQSWGYTVYSIFNLVYAKINGVEYGILPVNDEENVIGNFSLPQNYPNPFNPTTTIAYQIPQTGFVSIKVFDVLGNEVATLVNEEKPAGSYEVQFGASGLTSGIYFYQLRAGDYSETKKMILLR